MIIIDYDPASKIPPIHANDINKKLFISVISFPVDHFYYMSYAYKVSENLVAFRGISNSDRPSVEWEDTESPNILSTIIKERSVYEATYYIVESRQDFQYMVGKLGLKYFPVFLGEIIHAANVLFGPELP